MDTFKYGRRYPDPTHAARSILFKNILKAIPIHPLSDDYLAAMNGGWNILGNDKYGDCVAVAWANSRRFFSAELGGKENYPTQQEVFEIYKTQNPGFPNDDNGMDIQTLLEYLNQVGGPDGVKAVAFAKVDVTNLDEVKAAQYIFGGLLLGMDVQKENIADFNAGRPWDYHPNGTVDGGHGVLAGGYIGQTSNDMRFITWGAETSLTDAFWSNQVANKDGEAWVIIWPENLGTKQFADGIDLAALAADYKALTGNDLPITTPPATNPVPPGPAPIPPTPAPISEPGCLTGWIPANLRAKLIKLLGG